ncbi:MAG TPA: uracil phosphoribosyltransferase [Rhabdochlamydiaceae bacterium]|nr:uracil phosphoribosyltransferase [Rhabdochlamydiaceae bacterium]
MRSFQVCLVIILAFCFSKIYQDIVKDRLALSYLVHEIRDLKTDRKHFRACVKKIGEYMALDVLHELNTKQVEVQTPTGGTAIHVLCDEDPVLVTILRAGLPFLNGVQKVFPYSDVGFLGMARHEETFEAETSYVGIPDVKNKRVILFDTMLATGGSMLDAIKIVEKRGPKEIIILCAIAAKEGIDRILDHNPHIKIYAAAIDPKLNEKKYIIPGLGDAGDRSFGMKFDYTH